MVTWWEMRCGATKSSNATAYDATGAPVARPRHLLWCMGGGGRHPPHPAATAMSAHPSHHPHTHTHTPSAHLAMAPSVHPCCSQLFKILCAQRNSVFIRIKLAVARDDSTGERHKGWVCRPLGQYPWHKATTTCSPTYPPLPHHQL